MIEREGYDPSTKLRKALSSQTEHERISGIVNNPNENKDLSREDALDVAEENIRRSVTAWHRRFVEGRGGLGNQDKDIQGAMFQLENLQADVEELGLPEGILELIKEATAGLHRRFPKARNLKPKRYI